MTGREDLQAELARRQETLERLDGSDAIGDQRKVAHALLRKALVLGQLGRPDDAVAAFADVRDRYAQATDLTIRGYVASSWSGEGWMLNQVGRREEALVAYAAALDRIGASTEPEFQEKIVTALYGKAAALQGLERYSEAVETLAYLLTTYLDDPPEGSALHIANAALRIANLTADAGHDDTAIGGLDELIDRFGGDQSPALRDTVARAGISKAALLGKGRRFDEAIVVCDGVVSDLEAAPHPKFRGALAGALSDRAHWLDAAGRTSEATEAYQLVVAGFQRGESLEIDQRLQRAEDRLVT
jgi:tetratricopeptide (TPR) repeat protein